MADITLLATADWDHPLWTNKQHVACSLVALGHRVLYVESLGLRSPRQAAHAPVATQARSDWSRIRRRLCHGVQPPRQVRPGLWVWSPLVFPGALAGWRLAINRLVLRVGLFVWSRSLHLQADWLWTYNPMTLSVLDPRPWKRLIYHCVDAIQAQPGMPAREIEQLENRLCHRADIVFVTSPGLYRSLGTLNPQTYFYPNVADVNHFGHALNRALPIPDDLAAIPNPRLGFVGAISNYKLDVPMLVCLARNHPEWSLVLIGPVGEGDPSTDVTSLLQLKNVHLLGTRSYGELPDYLRGFDVGLLPLRLNAYTQSMFPMKFFEYLAAGLPVVSSAIDALQPFADVAFLCDTTATAFASAIAAALKKEGPTIQKRLAAAAANTYNKRTQAMLNDLAKLEMGKTVDPATDLTGYHSFDS